jgi:hypothetical protein
MRPKNGEKSTLSWFCWLWFLNSTTPLRPFGPLLVPAMVRHAANYMARGVAFVAATYVAVLVDAADVV